MSGIPLGRALGIVQPFIDALREACPEARVIEPVGDLRRFEPFVRRLEVGVSVDDVEAVLDCGTNLPMVDRVLGRGAGYAIVFSRDAAITLRVANPASFGSALVRWTGSDTHLKALRRRAVTLGVDAGLDSPDASGRGATNEEAVYAALGLPAIPPELRHGQDEIEIASQGPLPALITMTDIGGDLHVHSSWSDGRDTIEGMALAARNLGYQYVAITDHSPHAGTRRVVGMDSLQAQADELARVRQNVNGIAILHGIEVDILPDARLDLPDAVLERLDIVLASLHDPAGHGRKALTNRYVTAIQHPLVDIITHPTNRLVGYHHGYELDFDRIFEAAANTRTALEIDGAPMHLDMDGALAKRAVAAGVLVTIDSDGHRASTLGHQMQFGVATARRGWVQKRDVLNALPVHELRDHLQRRRSAS